MTSVSSVVAAALNMGNVSEGKKSHILQKMEIHGMFLDRKRHIALCKRYHKGAQALSALSVIWPWYLVSTLLLCSESFTAFVMEDSDIIKALFHHKQPPLPAHPSLFNGGEGTSWQRLDLKNAEPAAWECVTVKGSYLLWLLCMSLLQRV